MKNQHHQPKQPRDKPTTKWINKSIHVNTDTGEQIDKKDIKKYIIIKKIKNVQTNKSRTWGITEYTNECKLRKYIQGELPF